MEHTKEYIISEYKKLKNHFGKPPSSGEFFKETNISERDLIKVFGSKAYSKLVTECGDIPNAFSKPKSILEQIGRAHV